MPARNGTPAGKGGAQRRRPASPTSLIDMGFDWDASKLHGFRVDHSWGDAFQSIFDPSHNEFANITTDWIPLVFFIGVTYHFSQVCPGMPDALRQAYVYSGGFTAFQHLVSLAAHVFCCVNARVSHAIWYFDYAGICLNFIWNGSALTFILRPEAARFWPTWRDINLAISVSLLTAAAYRYRNYPTPPRAETGAPADAFSPFTPRSRLVRLVKAAAVGIVLLALGLPTELATALLAVCAPERAVSTYAALALLLLPVALSVKVFHLPERFTSRGLFDRSFLHSHSVWHILVCGVQVYYMLTYLNGVERYRSADAAAVGAGGSAAGNGAAPLLLSWLPAGASSRFHETVCGALP